VQIWAKCCRCRRRPVTCLSISVVVSQAWLMFCQTPRPLKPEPMTWTCATDCTCCMLLVHRVTTCLKNVEISVHLMSAVREKSVAEKILVGENCLLLRFALGLNKFLHFQLQSGEEVGGNRKQKNFFTFSL